MKKMLKIVGIAAVAVICFSMIACDGSGDDGWTSEGGKLTLTGIDEEYNGKYIIVRYGSIFYAGDSYKGSLVRGSAISGGSSELNAWEVIERIQFIPYSKTEDISIEILIMAQQEYDMATIGRPLGQNLPVNLDDITDAQKDGLNAIGVVAVAKANVEFDNGTGDTEVTGIIPTTSN